MFSGLSRFEECGGDCRTSDEDSPFKNKEINVSFNGHDGQLRKKTFNNNEIYFFVVFYLMKHMNHIQTE